MTRTRLRSLEYLDLAVCEELQASDSNRFKALSRNAEPLTVYTSVYRWDDFQKMGMNCLPSYGTSGPKCRAGIQVSVLFQQGMF